MNYYVLYVKGREEKRIQKFLNEKCSSWDVFFPTMEKLLRRKGVNQVVVRPLFPSYLFVRTNMDAREFHDHLFALRGQLSGIIRELEYEKDEIPAMMDYEVRFLEHILNEEDCMVISKGVIEEGVLHILSGPLQGYEKYISYIDRHKRLAIFSVEFRGREVQLKFSLEIIEKY